MAGNVVFFGRSVSIMALARHHVRSAGYEPEVFLDDDELFQRLDQGNVDLLVLGAGVEDGPRVQVRSYCEARGIKLIEHFGGPDRLVANVRTALS